MRLSCNPMTFQDKLILVTGASSGLGFEIAQSLSKSGATVLGLGRRHNLLEFHTFEYRSLDITNESHLLEFATYVQSLSTAIYGIVNCAGISLPPKTSPLSFDFNILHNNLSGIVNICQAFLPQMSHSRSGSIVNLSSIGAHLAFPNNPSYQASKAALEAYTRSIAYDYGTYNIRANCVAPGYFRTPMTDLSWRDSSLRAQRSKRSMLGRWGSMHEITGPVEFLLSPQSSFITGTTLFVDGGWHRKGL